ncbi:hypothetical protein [Chryseobacterium daeguense]|uniref:hypothetical protein n=1 Tax=Chryseobacterium daeguense TaxID=412438 RepID=UPI00041841B1|nr:hypothetical protein [Chryseobacterium daeguense]
MKFVLIATMLGFLVLSCKKQTDVSTTPSSDSIIPTDNTTAVPPDTTVADTTTSAAKQDTADINLRK